MVLPDRPVRPGALTRLMIRALVPATRIASRRSPATLRRLLGRLAAGARPAGYDEAKSVRDEVLTVSPVCRGGSACLVRSLTVAVVCRARGFWPDWCVGVLVTPPFAAHAWVQAEDRIVDEPMAPADLRTFFTVPPGGARR